jgi:hypothetical protein
MQFKSKDPHESAKIPVIQLKFKGIYDSYFDAQIEIMGTYLVVLLAHRSRCKINSYQTLYLVDWVKGRVLCVRAPPTTFALCEFLLITSPVATTLPRKYILPSSDIHIGGHLRFRAYQ